MSKITLAQNSQRLLSIILCSSLFCATTGVEWQNYQKTSKDMKKQE